VVLFVQIALISTENRNKYTNIKIEDLNQILILFQFINAEIPPHFNHLIPVFMFRPQIFNKYTDLKLKFSSMYFRKYDILMKNKKGENDFNIDL
jgi:hypothetical protein